MEELQLNYLLGVFLLFFCLFVVGFFGDAVATRATAHTLRKGNSLASHLKVEQQVENKGSRTRSSWSPHTALPCTAGGRQKSVVHLFTCLFLIWFDQDCFFSKSCIFLRACWGRRTDFPAGSSTLKLGGRRALWVSKHVQFDCNVGKSIYSETVQNLHPHNAA